MKTFMALCVCIQFINGSHQQLCNYQMLVHISNYLSTEMATSVEQFAHLDRYLASGRGAAPRVSWATQGYLKVVRSLTTLALMSQHSYQVIINSVARLIDDLACDYFVSNQDHLYRGSIQLNQISKWIPQFMHIEKMANVSYRSPREVNTTSPMKG